MGAVGAAVILSGDTLEAGLAGLALVYVLQVTSLFQWGFRMASEAANHLTSVERIHECCLVPQEPATETEADATLTGWPQHGAIRFQDVQLRYRPGLPLVLNGASFAVPAGAKAAVVGRTGAGKSSLAVALFRLVELSSGTISVDGVDIGTLGLHAVRAAFTFIPQQPLLFGGTVCSNVDPAGAHSHQTLAAALDAVAFSRHTGAALDTPLAEGGANLSAGARQLLMLARALLRRTLVLVMDEATSSCDAETDGTIQRVVRERFGESTLLTIAHRLETIIDFDMVLVMDRGAVQEQGAPDELICRRDSAFARFVRNTGEENERRLSAAAREAASIRRSQGKR